MPRQHEIHDMSRFKCHAVHLHFMKCKCNAKSLSFFNVFRTTFTMPLQHLRDMAKALRKLQRNNNNATTKQSTTKKQQELTQQRDYSYNNYNKQQTQQ